ncbi:SUMF1/EgtB/PvdO family nonheme iron enzyme [Mastigocoleus testarum]|uniref:SUMF1/EgtB/PvdO family nonheme iron enzyme n=1 Tax=Mastigocoleus testarum TaxID=996925 RepID=UPI000414A3D4
MKVFEAQGRLTELISGAIKQNSGNPQLQEVQRKYNNLLTQNNNQNPKSNTQYSQKNQPITESLKVPEIPENFPQINNYQPVTESSKVLGKAENSPQINTFTFKFATITKETKSINYHYHGNQYFTEKLGNQISLEMVWIPGGSFIMGAPKTEEGSGDSERPQREVRVPSFWMGKHPVTQKQWKAVAGLPRVNCDLKPDSSHFKGDNRPVEQVSWYDAVEFCARLSNHTGRQYSLPSEAQWEYACRAGTTTPFNFGETITTELASCQPNIEASLLSLIPFVGQGTTPVGSFVSNAFGLYDMHGNVWE